MEGCTGTKLVSVTQQFGRPTQRVDESAIIVENSPLAKPYRLGNNRNQKVDRLPVHRFV